MKTELVWATPAGDKLVAYMARVSNPVNQDNEETAPRLINYLIRHRHWSPFEMVNACIEIHTTRDIGRQILRHRSFSFQEFSQRYGAVGTLVEDREMRTKGGTTRQGSRDGTRGAHGSMETLMLGYANASFKLYEEALEQGVAPECARALLPEGYTPTRMYMNGTLRSWIHYLHERCQPVVQKEHRVLAESIRDLLTAEFPMIFEAVRLSQEA